jgi:hypothetical protein
MNWSRSVVTFSGGGARAHPPGVAPEASVECFDFTEVFCMLEDWLCAVEPPSLVREVDQNLGRLLLFDPHAPFFEKREKGWGTSYYPRLGEFRRSPVSY